jgi:signal transduction histidine kinase
MTESRLDSNLDARERRLGRATRVMPYVLLAAATILSWPLSDRSQAYRLGTLGIAGLAAAWMLWMVTLHPEWTRRRALMAVYFLGLLAFIAVLVTRNPWFGLFAVTGYLHAWEVLAGRWRLAGVTAAAVLHVTAIFGGRPPSDLAGGLAFVVLVVVIVATTAVFAGLSDTVSDQNQQRKRMIAELAEANHKLEAAMAENEGLHAQLLTQAREAGVLDERQRMAREIHDTLAQGLTGIITQVQAAQGAGDRPADWRRHLENAAQLAREILSEARRSVQAVGPEPLRAARLPEALAEVVDRWSGMHGVAAEVATTGTPRPMHPEVEVALLRTAQEALANVAKHAGASRVVLTLSYMEDLVTLDIRDDGVGFDPAAGTAIWAGIPAIPREAARRLFISEASVKAHLLHIYAKLGVNDRAAAVAAAYDRGLLTPGGR